MESQIGSLAHLLDVRKTPQNQTRMQAPRKARSAGQINPHKPSTG